ncbi:Acyl-protein synthetase, LuxE [Verrucomicrobium sp. GAS474]|nr:Acyl-protein synthetase, LuxE [Verrucomicrobium sp. GAS474]
MFLTPSLRAAWWRRIAALKGGDDVGFNQAALELFAWQFSKNAPYRTWCRAEGVDSPKAILSWREIPSAPQELFKRKTLFCHPAKSARALYRTSGTTTGRKGMQRLLFTDLYRASALAAAELVGPFSMPGLPKRLPLLCLAPSPEENPHSSLSAMLGFFIEARGDRRHSRFFVEGDRLRLDALARALKQAEERQTPVGILGTAFAFVHLIDAGLGPFRLPEGSFLMETGGFKGRSREVAKPLLYQELSKLLGLPLPSLWNEYGMTELSSQAYAQGPVGAHHLPPWTRILPISPVNGKIQTKGRQGLLRWIDLANVDGVLALETADLGLSTINDYQHFRLIGRVPQLPRRGCSLDAEDLQ